MQFELNFGSDCANDQVSHDSSDMQDIIYKIGVSQVLQVATKSSQKFPGCPMLYELIYIDGENESLGGYVRIDEADGTIILENESDYDLDGEMWNLRVKATSTDSMLAQNSVELDFAVEWRDPCHDSVLAPAKWSDDIPQEIALNAPVRLPYESMEDLSYGRACGGYTNYLQYVDGPAYDPSEPFGADLNDFFFSMISATEFVLIGSFTDKKWIGTNSFQIQSRNGFVSNFKTRGDRGLFGAIDSDIITITVVDSCAMSIVNSDGGLTLDNMIAPDGVPELESRQYRGPTNSADLSLGNGYQFCGLLSYTLLTAGKTAFTEDWFKIEGLQQSAG